MLYRTAYILFLISMGIHFYQAPDFVTAMLYFSLASIITFAAEEICSRLDEIRNQLNAQKGISAKEKGESIPLGVRASKEIVRGSPDTGC